jgi:hypothetical protein
MATYLQKLQDYQKQTEGIQDGYRAEVQAYQDKADQYAEDMKTFQEDKATWEINRNAAVSKAEGTIDTFYKNFGWAFMSKEDLDQYWSRLKTTRAIQALSSPSTLCRSCSLSIEGSGRRRIVDG